MASISYVIVEGIKKLLKNGVALLKGISNCCCPGGCPCPSRSGTINVTFSVTSSPAWCDFNGDYTTDAFGGNLEFDFDGAGGPGLSSLLAEFIDTANGGSGTGVAMAIQIYCCEEDGVYLFNAASSGIYWEKYEAGVRVCRTQLPLDDGCGEVEAIVPATVTLLSCNPLHITIVVNGVTDPDDPMNTGTFEMEITE